MTPSEPDAEPKAAVEWGDDVDPRIEDVLEFMHTRVYHGFHASAALRKRLDADEWDRLPRDRLRADDLLTDDERRDLEDLEREIRRIEAGRSPVGSTHELDAAWCELLADARDRDRDVDRGGEPHR